MTWETLILPYANNKGADQAAYLRSLISAFVILCLESIVASRDLDTSFHLDQFNASGGSYIWLHLRASSGMYFPLELGNQSHCYMTGQGPSPNLALA